MRWLTVVLAAIVLFVATASITAMLWLSPTQARHGIAGVEFSSVANAQVDQPTDGTAPARAGVTVTGEGVIAVKPDLARVTLGVEVSNPSASAAQQDAAVRMDAVVGQRPEPWDRGEGYSDYSIRPLAGVREQHQRWTVAGTEGIQGYQHGERHGAGCLQGRVGARRGGGIRGHAAAGDQFWGERSGSRWGSGSGGGDEERSIEG